MAKIHSEECVIEYAVDFKIKVIELTEQLDADTIQIAEILGLHLAGTAKTLRLFVCFKGVWGARSGW